jgi:hypothetical protein
MSKTTHVVTVRLTKSQRAGMLDAYDIANAERKDAGQEPVSLNTWWLMQVGLIAEGDQPSGRKRGRPLTIKRLEPSRN